jgi:hypothetical protein
MCKKHEPIVVYDCGGTQNYCGKCGKVLSKWKPNGKEKKPTKKEGK